MALVKPFYVKSRANPEIEGIALTHDVLQYMKQDEEGKPTGEIGARVEIGVAWTLNKEEDFDPGTALSPHSPEELIFDGVYEEIEYEDDEDEEEDEE